MSAPAESPLRVVVVDDDPDIRLVMRLAFEMDGRLQVVAEAADGADAVALAREHQPDLVLLDLNMPGVDGLAALPEVQAATGPDTTVVIMSATPAPAGAPKEGIRFLEKHGDLTRFVGELLDLIAAPAPAEIQDSGAVTWHLPADLRSGGLARERLRELLRGWDLRDVLDEVELLSTELINNAVVHAGSEVVLEVRRRADVLHVAVTDTGVGAPYRPHANQESVGGRGLMLVETLSRAWGVAMNDHRKTLWFEIALPAPPGGPAPGHPQN